MSSKPAIAEPPPAEPAHADEVPVGPAPAPTTEPNAAAPVAAPPTDTPDGSPVAHADTHPAAPDAEHAGAAPAHTPPASPNPSGKPNRRSHSRKSFFTAAVLHEIDDQGQPGPSNDCSAVDVSRGGLGVRMRKMLYPGRKVFVNLNFKDGDGRLFYGEVRACRYHNNGLYHIGIQFERLPQRRFIARWMAHRGYKAA